MYVLNFPLLRLASEEPSLFFQVFVRLVLAMPAACGNRATCLQQGARI
jgi:hypothetical protein